MKQYSKEKLGRIDASFSSEGIFTIPHSPEQEQSVQRLIEQLRPYFMQAIQQAITLYIDANLEYTEGDIIQYVINYITNKFFIEGVIYTAGNGIQISANTISVRAGDGLDASSGDLDVDLATDPGLQITSAKLEAKCNTEAALDKDSDGLKIVLSDTVQTGGGSGSGGLSFVTSGDHIGVRVNPEDFLYLGS